MDNVIEFGPQPRCGCSYVYYANKVFCFDCFKFVSARRRLHDSVFSCLFCARVFEGLNHA